MINRAATLVSLARAQLQALDTSRTETTLPTATLALLLEGVVFLGEPDTTQKIGDAAAREVEERIARTREAIDARVD